MDGSEAVWRLTLALGIGFLIGIERGRHPRDEGGGARIAGVRTFALMGLLGVGNRAMAWRIGAVTAAIALAVAVGVHLP